MDHKTQMKQLSLLARFDDLCRQTMREIKDNGPDLKTLILKTEEIRIKWLQAETELRAAKKHIAQLTEQNKELDSKLSRMRQAYGREVFKAQNGQKDAEKYRAILDLVRQTVTEDFRGSQESLITTSSEGIDYMLSVLNNPDEFLKNKVRKSDVVRKSASFDNVEMDDLFDKTDDSLNSNVPPTMSDHIEHDIRTESETEAPNVTEVSLAPSMYTPMALRSTASVRRNASRKAVPTDLRRLDSRPHKLTRKQNFKSVVCNVCDKKIGFCSPAYFCDDCKSVAHPDCQRELPKPCIPIFTVRKHERKVIGDFVDLTVRPHIPPLLVFCCKEIEAKHLKEEGLYRKSGSDSKVRKMKESILKSVTGCPRLDDNPDNVCGTVKLFLRELSEPLVTTILWHDFIKVTEAFDEPEFPTEGFERQFLRVLNRLPDTNRDVLAYIMLHLKRVADKCEHNKMTEANLAMVFAPTIVGWSTNTGQLGARAGTQEISLQTRCMHAMLSLPKEFWNNVLENPRNLDGSPAKMTRYG